MKRLQLVLMMLISACFVAPCYADDSPDHIVEKSIYFDTTGELTVDQITNKTFSPFQGHSGRGYNKGAIWIKVVTKPTTDNELILRIRPNNRNFITLFSKSSERSSGWDISTTGNKVPWNDRPMPSKDLGFKIQPKSTATYYLKMETLGGATIQLDAIPVTVFEREELVGTLWQLGYLIVFGLVVGWAAHTFFLQRNILTLIFAIGHGLYMVLALAISGFVAPLFPESTFTGALVYGLVPLTTATIFYFHRTLLLTRQIPGWAKSLLSMLVIASSASALMVFTIDVRLGLKINSFAILLGVMITLIVAISSRRDDQPKRTTLITYYALLLISVLTHLLPILGLVNIPILVSNGVLFHGIISCLLFGHLLHEQSKAREMIINDAETALAVNARESEIKEQMLDQQRLFTAMLTHELKNPIASIRLTLDTFQQSKTPTDEARINRINKAIDEIDYLVEQCVLSDAIDGGRVALNLSTVNAKPFISEILSEHSPTKNVQIIAEIEHDALNTDRSLLRIAISNLIANALTYSPSQETIMITIEEIDSGIAFTIQNKSHHGQTLDPSLIFKKYYRGTESLGSQGFGLGLYLVNWIANRLGGSISLTTHHETNSFCLWIPKNSSLA